MTVTAISMFKDEADIAEASVRHMLGQVDRVMIADNGSTDGTREILRGLFEESHGKLTVMDDDQIGYYQSQKMSTLAEGARVAGADWIVPFDADELWTGKRGTVKSTLERVPNWILCAHASLYDHVATGRDNGAENPFQRIRWRRRNPIPLPKVAFRAVKGAVVHQGNHGVTLPRHDVPAYVGHLLGVRHFPYRSPEQFIRKVRNGAAAYAATDLPEEVGQHWRGYGRMSDEDLIEHYHKWFYRSEPDQDIVIDGEKQPPLVEDPARIGG